jgi:hypothetical protein
MLRSVAAPRRYNVVGSRRSYGEGVVTLFEWVLKWRVPPEALKELADTCVFLGKPEGDAESGLEAPVQRELRLEAARGGRYLFRNQRGAGRMESGNFVRFGLANDSKKLGDTVKSADLIGIETLFITIDMVLEDMARGLPGYKVGRFLSVEAKSPVWTFTGSLEDLAQLKWASFVNSAGGRALITNKPGVL